MIDAHPRFLDPPALAGAARRAGDAARFGAWNFTRLPIDAVPDITNVQVQINTEAPGYSPLEVEQRITFPIETAMAGLPQPRVHALALALRPVAGDGRLQGRHRHLLRAPARQRAHPAGQGPAAAGHRARDGPDRDRPRRDLHVHGRGQARRAQAPTASPTRRPTCARSRTGSSSRSCATCPASPRSTPSAATRSSSTCRPIPARLLAYGLDLPRRDDGARAPTTPTSAPATSSATASSTWSARRARSPTSTTSATSSSASRSGVPIRVRDVADVARRQGAAHRRRDARTARRPCSARP